MEGGGRMRMKRKKVVLPSGRGSAHFAHKLIHDTHVTSTFYKSLSLSLRMLHVDNEM